MSNKKSDDTPVVSTSKFSIVRAIVTLFKLGEEGKIESFFAKQRKAMDRDIAKLEKAAEVAEFNHNNAVEDHNEKLEDARDRVEQAYLQVDPERLATNADQDAYADTYWSNVELAEANVQTLEEELKRKNDAHEENMKSIREQIAERKRRVARISAPAK